MKIQKCRELSTGNTAVADERETHTCTFSQCISTHDCCNFRATGPKQLSVHQNHLLLSFHRPDTLGHKECSLPGMSQSSPTSRYYNLPVIEDERMEVAKSVEFATEIF